ncbi:phage tail tape measure C-terminal domain-containing protein [Luteithermobacter gelatinilyticus]|uniref:phage tail tape measure C-terminal domain-containing protein n=1 Tax=Luteithermobacter gelatinilyticus TaxID=2582913 RepID=UPI001106BFDD|nr:phage tail tape measure C-terminal domain-containing protein [Luteithermobacter gelatinilyticus]
MTETLLDSLVVKIRADNSAFKTDLASLKQEITGLDELAQSAIGGMTRALTNFVRTGELNFDSLKRTALAAIQDILDTLLRSGLESILGGANGSLGGIVLSSFLFGREGGGAVAPNRPYLVGEKGPEIFLPHSPGRIVSDAGPMPQNGVRRVTNITINLTQQGAGESQTRKSAAQIAVAVRRAMEKAERNL